MADVKSEGSCMRCLMCKQLVPFTNTDPTALLHHIWQQHPEVDVCFSKCLNKKASKLSNRSIKSGKQSRTSVPDETENSTKTSKLCRDFISFIQKNALVGKSPTVEHPETCSEPEPSSNAPNENYARYWSSLESFTLDPGELYCPTCNCSSKAIVKSRCQLFFPCCLPLVSFLAPFCSFIFFGGDDHYYLFCPACEAFLARYNDITKVIRPNKRFVELYNPGMPGIVSPP